VGGRQSGRPLAATNVQTAGGICKRHDAVHLGRKKGLQPRASERPAVACSGLLGSGFAKSRRVYFHEMLSVTKTKRFYFHGMLSVANKPCKTRTCSDGLNCAPGLR